MPSLKHDVESYIQQLGKLTLYRVGRSPGGRIVKVEYQPGSEGTKWSVELGQRAVSTGKYIIPAGIAGIVTVLKEPDPSERPEDSALIGVHFEGQWDSDFFKFWELTLEKPQPAS